MTRIPLQKRQKLDHKSGQKYGLNVTNFQERGPVVLEKVGLLNKISAA